MRYVMVHEMDTVMSVDPAISESIKADRSGIVVSGTLDGVHHILLEALAERRGVHDLCKIIKELHNRYKCRRIYIESIAYQKALFQILQHDRLPVIEVKSHSEKTKEIRIRGLEPFFRQGNIYYNTRQIDFLREYRSFSRGRWDDILDACSMLTDEWGRTIGSAPGVDSRKNIDDAALEKIKKWSTGHRYSSPRRGRDRRDS